MVKFQLLLCLTASFIALESGAADWSTAKCIGFLNAQMDVGRMGKIYGGFSKEAASKICKTAQEGRKASAANCAQNAMRLFADRNEPYLLATGLCMKLNSPAKNRLGCVSDAVKTTTYWDANSWDIIELCSGNTVDDFLVP